MELIIHSNQLQEVEGISAHYPYVLNRVSSAQTRVPWHWHEEVEFSLVRSGALKVSIAGHSRVFRENEGFFINTNILHTMEPEREGEEVRWDSHMLHPTLLGGPYRSIFDTKYMAPILKNRNCELVEFCTDDPQDRQITALLDRAAAMQSDPFSEFRTRNLFCDIWLMLMGKMEKLERDALLPRPVSQERIQMMLGFIHQHYAENLTLEQIAAAAIISRRECLRCFQSCIQKTPFEYLMDYRLRMAEQMLRTTTHSITDVAMRAGFGTGAYFTKCFRESRGITPGQYRKQCRDA